MLYPNGSQRNYYQTFEYSYWGNPIVGQREAFHFLNLQKNQMIQTLPQINHVKLSDIYNSYLRKFHNTLLYLDDLHSTLFILHYVDFLNQMHPYFTYLLLL